MQGSNITNVSKIEFSIGIQGVTVDCLFEKGDFKGLVVAIAVTSNKVKMSKTSKFSVYAFIFRLLH